MRGRPKFRGIIAVIWIGEQDHGQREGCRAGVPLRAGSPVANIAGFGELLAHPEIGDLNEKQWSTSGIFSDLDQSAPADRGQYAETIGEGGYKNGSPLSTVGDLGHRSRISSPSSANLCTYAELLGRGRIRSRGRMSCLSIELKTASYADANETWCVARGKWHLRRRFKI